MLISSTWILYMQVLTIAILTSYPFMTVLSGLTLSVVLNIASVLKNIFIVCFHTTQTQTCLFIISLIECTIVLLCSCLTTKSRWSQFLAIISWDEFVCTPYCQRGSFLYFSLKACLWSIKVARMFWFDKCICGLKM